MFSNSIASSNARFELLIFLCLFRVIGTNDADIPIRQLYSWFRGEVKGTPAIVTQADLKVKEICNRVCFDSNVFPTAIKEGIPNKRDSKKFIAHLKRVNVDVIDVNELMLACNDLKNAPCMNFSEIATIIVALGTMLVISMAAVVILLCWGREPQKINETTPLIDPC